MSAKSLEQLLSLGGLREPRTFQRLLELLTCLRALALLGIQRGEVIAYLRLAGKRAHGLLEQRRGAVE